MFNVIFYLGLCLLLGCGSLKYLGYVKEFSDEYPSDNFIEEFLEEEIEDYLDVEDGSIDLSPFSAED